MRPWLIGMASLVGGWTAARTLTACKGDDKCAEVDCDYTHVTVEIVDDEDEASLATRVTFTLHPYKDNGVLMTEDELDDAGIDVEEVRQASCVSADEDECARWIAAAGFGVYTFTAVLADEEEGTQIKTQCQLDLPPPTDPEDKACCGLVATDETEMTLDEDDLDAIGEDTADTGGGTDTGTPGEIPACP